MIKHERQEYGGRDYQRSGEDGSLLGLVVLAFFLLTAGSYLLVSRFHVRPAQVAELGLYLLGLGVASVTLLWHFTSGKRRRQREWPHPALFVPMLKDDAYMRSAWSEKAILAGYDIFARPWFWHDDARRMQTVVLGQSGSGKSTLLHNIASQDIHRTINGRHLPVVIFDGKGDQSFLSDLLPEIVSAGRQHQLKILDPSRPDISVRFNPLYHPKGSSPELVNAFFDSFLQQQNFFAAHQATYLTDVCRVLDHTGRIYSIPDVLVMARDPLVMRNQIEKAAHNVAHQAILRQQKQNFEISARNLLQSLEDRERVQKIQGLLNELATFTEHDLSQITNSYTDLLTLDEIVAQGWILFASLNTNKNARAVTALGRVLLQNLQLLVGQRYMREPGTDRREPSPMVSVILDEFAPFAYGNFAQILETARGSNVAFVFSLQSIPQLRNVSRSFGDEVSSAPNTIMLLRTRDEETARYFLNASARITGERRTMRVEKKGVLEQRYEEIGFGSITEVEKTRAVDFEIKNLPVGQMQVLTTDNRLGTLHMHLHVRRPPHYRLGDFSPAIYPRLAEYQANPQGANLEFTHPALRGRISRIPVNVRPRDP